MGVQVVQHHPDLLRFGVSSVRQPAHLMGEVFHGATLRHCHVPPARQWLTSHEQVPGPVALVLVIKPLPPSDALAGMHCFSATNCLEVSSKQTTGRLES